MNNKSLSKPIVHRFFHCLLTVAACWALTACSDDVHAPHIDSVWYNMVSQPIEEAPCAYPGQTVCIHGEYLGDLRKVVVNGTEINLNTLYVYESPTNITFQLPSDVNTEGDLLHVVTKWGAADYPFIVRPSSEKPAITAFSATTLIPGRTLTISGAHLDGAREVWLPVAFGQYVQCEMDATQTNDATRVHVIVPDGVRFATGYCFIVMDKSDEARGISYTEKVYSASTNFLN